MRKISPTLQGQGFNSFKDLLSRPSNVLTVGPDKCAFTSPLDAANAAQSGDLIFVFPGTYDLGNNSILLKDNVNWQFLSNVFITSSSSNGTFYDNNEVITLNFEGNPRINNTGGGKFFNINSQSNILNYEIKFSIQVVQITPTLLEARFKSNLGDELFSNVSASKHPSYHIWVVELNKTLGPSPSNIFRTYTWDTVGNRNLFLDIIVQTSSIQLIATNTSTNNISDNFKFSDIRVNVSFPIGRGYYLLHS